MTNVKVMGLDPGFASFGWACLEISRGPAGQLLCHPVDAGVIQTKKADKKQHTYATEDNLSRARELATDLSLLLDRYQPRAICAEGMSFPRQSSVAAKMAMAWGVIAGELVRRQIACLQVTPQALKKRLAGQTVASKEQVADGLLERFPVLFRPAWTAILARLPKGRHEHMNDAASSIVACLDADALRLLCS